MRKVFWVVFLTITILTASGCSRYVHPALLIPNTISDYETTEIKVAVDFFGVKHIAIILCLVSDSDVCYLNYTRVDGSGKLENVWN